MKACDIGQNINEIVMHSYSLDYVKNYITEDEWQCFNSYEMITLLAMFKFAWQRKVENVSWNHLEMQSSHICNCMDVTSHETVLKQNSKGTE